MDYDALEEMWRSQINAVPYETQRELTASLGGTLKWRNHPLVKAVSHLSWFKAADEYFAVQSRTIEARFSGSQSDTLISDLMDMRRTPTPLLTHEDDWLTLAPQPLSQPSHKDYEKIIEDDAQWSEFEMTISNSHFNEAFPVLPSGSGDEYLAERRLDIDDMPDDADIRDMFNAWNKMFDANLNRFLKTAHTVLAAERIRLCLQPLAWFALLATLPVLVDLIPVASSALAPAFSHGPVLVILAVVAMLGIQELASQFFMVQTMMKRQVLEIRYREQDARASRHVASALEQRRRALVQTLEEGVKGMSHAANHQSDSQDADAWVARRKKWFAVALFVTRRIDALEEYIRLTEWHRLRIHEGARLWARYARWFFTGRPACRGCPPIPRLAFHFAWWPALATAAGAAFAHIPRQPDNALIPALGMALLAGFAATVVTTWLRLWKMSTAPCRQLRRILDGEHHHEVWLKAQAGPGRHAWLSDLIRQDKARSKTESARREA